MRWIRWTTRLSLYHRDGFRCVWCGCAVYRGRGHRVATLDHLVTRYEVGRNTTGNLATACHTCNTERGKRTLGEWLALLSREDGEYGVLSEVITRMTHAMNGTIDRRVGRAMCRKKFGRLV